MKKAIFALFVSLFSLTACYLPVVKKEVTVPFLEKKPPEALEKMFQAMAQVKSGSYDFNLRLKTRLDLSQSKLKNSQKLKKLSALRPRVLGEEESFASSSQQKEKQNQDSNFSRPNTSSEPNDLSQLPFLNGPTDIEFKYQAKGQYDISNPKLPRSQATINFNTTLSGTEMKVEAEVRNLNDITYLKVNKLPSPLGSLVNQFMGKWLEIDWQKLAQKQAELLAQSGLSAEVPNFDLEENKARAERIQKEVKKLFLKYKLFQVKKRLRDEQVDGHKCYHYQVSLIRENLSQLLEGVLNILTLEFNKENPVLLQGLDKREEWQDKIKQINKVLAKAQGEFWIDKKDFYLRRYNFNLNFDLTRLEVDKEIKKHLPQNIEIDLSGHLADFNQPVKINKPKESESLLDIIEAEMQKEMVHSRDAKRLSDIAQIQTALELYYNDVGRYPEELEEGGTLAHGYKTYMLVVPANPSPGGLPYTYVPKDDGQSYLLSYQLEAGFADVPGGVTVCATPDSIKGDCVSAASTSTRQSQTDSRDTDDDGLSDKLEKIIYFTDPLNPDTDRDGYLDGDEVKNGFNPLGSGRLKDTDKDKLPAYAEEIYETSDSQADTDHDGYNDYEEILNGFNPRGEGILKK